MDTFRKERLLQSALVLRQEKTKVLITGYAHYLLVRALAFIGLLTLLLAAEGPASLAVAESFEQQETKFASGTGDIIFIAASAALPLLEDGDGGMQHTLRTLDAITTSSLMTEVLKKTVRERRPRGSSRSSYPSGHATAAFAGATMESEYHPGQAWAWFGAASLIAASRVQLHRHFVHDVVAGGAIGLGTAEFELFSPKGLLFFPIIRAEDKTVRVGIKGRF